MKKGVVTKRVTWEDTTPFPENPIYSGRLRNLRKRWGGYRHDLIRTPDLFDNTGGAFPEHPPETLFVGDGNHRRALAEEDGKLGEEFIAKIHRGLSRGQMYEIRKGGNDQRTVKPAENFISDCERTENGIERRIRADVEGAGWHISYEREDKGLPYTNELTWIWVKSPSAMVRAILTYEAAFGVKPHSSQGRVLKGLGAFWIKYPDADADRLLKSLKRVTVADIYKSGKNQNDSHPFIKSVYDGIRYSLAMGYNRQSKKDALPLG